MRGSQRSLDCGVEAVEGSGDEEEEAEAQVEGGAMLMWVCEGLLCGLLL